MKESPASAPRANGAAVGIHIGIVVALPVESAAVRMLVKEPCDVSVPNDPNQYRSGWLPSKDPNRPHRVLVALPAREGTRDAAAMVSDMARSFPELRVFVVCGIAGGVPAPSAPSRHVALGDIVVADSIVDYRHVRRVDGVETLRRNTTGLSAALLRADNELRVLAEGGVEPWHKTLMHAMTWAQAFRRPNETSDPHYVIIRALSPDGAPLRPRVWRGVVGSADTLLRDSALRDALADQYGIIAFEMEGAGVAVAADRHERHWFMVRGITDYCDSAKDDTWHRYAALAAASYVTALLAAFPPCGEAPGSGKRPSDNMAAMHVIVDALLDLPEMTDDQQRRAVMAQLPRHIRAAVPDNAKPRLHVLGLVNTCQSIEGGEEALINALRLAIGADSPAFLKIEQIVRSNWSES
jgi:nucleoside phosphorylase